MILHRLQIFAQPLTFNM